MKMDRHFKQFERSIDGWNRKLLLVMNADYYKFRSRFAKFVNQMKNIHN